MAKCVGQSDASLEGGEERLAGYSGINDASSVNVLLQPGGRA